MWILRGIGKACAMFFFLAAFIGLIKPNEDFMTRIGASGILLLVGALIWGISSKRDRRPGRSANEK